ncbi:MAG: HDOD domain-containing protein, partial [Deltaproteobacteria bacterium]|nr:HDOD domain-containing protein [Deltaproteobacteria bacterium]
NSAYCSLPNQVTSLTRAIIMLGINTVKNLSLSTAVLASLGGKESFQGLSMDDFWTHSICVGVTAKSLAAIKDIPSTNLEEYFVAGLLHDLGKIPLFNCFPEEYGHALENVTPKQASLRYTENIMFGIDHCMVGKMIAEKWQLGDAIYDSIYYHHNPEEAGDQNSPLITIVSLANTCSNIFEIGSSGDAFSDRSILSRLLDKVGVSWVTISELRETVLKEIEKAKVFLQITQKG